MIVKILNAYMSTVMGENITPIVDVNQYDHDGKQIQILVRDMDISGMYAVVDGKKPDDTYVYNKTTISDSSVFIDITLQMTAVSGSYDMQVTLFNESDDSRAGIYKYTLRIAAATVPDPTVVSTDEYTALVTNAKEYDDAAAASAAAASASAASASESASQADQSATNAAESEQLSGISATDAATHELAAKGYADAAGLSATAAGQAATQAGQSATNAAASATAAGQAATQAGQSATNAAASATAAGQAATQAAGSATDAQSAQTATESARDAAVAAKTAAETARDSAISSKTAAATSKSNAASSAAAASTSADNASTSATAANTSASNASSSASAADAAKTAAASSASAAATSEANAASSAQAAANSAKSLVVVNDLVTGGTDKALSAEQGKVLSAAISTSSGSIVHFDLEQSLTTEQRHQARKNIGAAAVVDIKDAYELQEAVRQGRAKEILSVGDYFTVGRGGTDWLFQVAAFDYDVPVNPNFTHSLRLLMYPCFAAVAFDAQEAIYYAAAKLPAGTYWFINNRTSKYYSFTTTQAIPAGGQAVPVFGASPDYTITQLKTYVSQSSQTVLETVTATISDIAPTTGTQLTPVNDDNRARAGNNNWMQSAIRQWLNSAATTGWWTPKNNYDRPQSSPTDGFLNGIDADLLACIGKVRLRTGLNPVDNAGTFGYSDNAELIFLPSRTEVGLGNSSTNIYETPVAADGTAKTGTLPLFTDNASRVKYLAQVASNWWVRSPYAYTPASTHHVYTNGALSTMTCSNGAYGVCVAVPACVIY